MKIAILNWRDVKHPQAGGAELYLYEQAKRWKNWGDEITWITSKAKGEKRCENLEGINFIRNGKRVSVYFWAALNYFRYARKCDIIIDAENGIPFFTPLYSKKKKILLIHHIHKDVWKREFKFPIAHLGQFIETKVMPRIYNNTKIVTVSESSKKEIRKLFPKNSIEIIYNAVDEKNKPGKKSKTPEVVFVGRIKKYKSIDVLLRAVAEIDRNIKVNIIGRGDDEERLKNICRELNLRRVIFHGFASNDNKCEILKRSWVAVNPSLVEGWSITNIESNANGTIVIGSNVPGIRDSIIDNKTGLLFEYGNYVDLANKLRKVLNDVNFRKRMEKEAIKWAKQFSWDKSATNFRKIMNS